MVEGFGESDCTWLSNDICTAFKSNLTDSSTENEGRDSEEYWEFLDVRCLLHDGV